jgi:hypothetical protein
MKINYRNGLLFTSVKVTYKGKSRIIDNIVIDAGTAKSII